MCLLKLGHRSVWSGLQRCHIGIGSEHEALIQVKWSVWSYIAVDGICHVCAIREASPRLKCLSYKDSN